MFLAVLCISCSAPRYGVFTLRHRHAVGDDYEAVVFESGNDSRFEVWKGGYPNGSPICQMTADADGALHAVISAPGKTSESFDLASIFHDGTNLLTSRSLSVGVTNIIVMDRDGDGLPDTRTSDSPSIFRHETITPVFNTETEKRESVEQQFEHVP